MAERGFKFTEQPQQKIGRGQFNALARKYGLPAKGFWQITKGESGHKPYVQQHDPGDGNVGYGLFQLTPNAWGGGAAAQKYRQLGGTQGMRNIENQFKMARFLYKSAGNSFKPWYGTRFLTDRSGEGTLGPVRKGMQVQGGGGGGGGGGQQRRVGGRAVTSAQFNPNLPQTSALGRLISGPQRQVSSTLQMPDFAAQAPVATASGQTAQTTPVAASAGPAKTAVAGATLSQMISQITDVSEVSPLSSVRTVGGRTVGGQMTGGGGGVAGGRKVATATKRANAFERKGFAYKWGGGHGSKLVRAKNFVPVDCSGAVSAVLKIDPRVAAQFTNWGKAGDGGRRGITVYANDDHVLMKINGRFFGTSGSNPGGGAGWIDAKPTKSYLSAFTARHL